MPARLRAPSSHRWGSREVRRAIRGVIPRAIPRARHRACRLAPAAVLGAVLVLLGGCGGEAATPGDEATPSAADSPTGAGSEEAAKPSDPSASETEPPDDPGTVIEVTIADGRVTPRGERVRVAVGEPITVAIASDVPGEMHVHATPEEEWEFPAGRSRHGFTLTQPGVADMELHEPALTVVQLEAR